MSNKHNNRNFEIEINGLRGIAVILVILFHYEIYPFSGGYVGVDIFFVISGYLIGKIINKTNFSFSNYKTFLLNRVKRIFPGLLGLIFVTFIFFSLVLSPNHFIDFSKSIFYNFTLIPNYFFWTQSNYFDVSSYYKPLLHTWSLGVEYHFYLIWPFFIWFLSLITKKNLFKNIFLIFLVILILFFTEYLKQFTPVFEHDLLYGKYVKDTIFFLSPFRFFEFTIGYLLTYNNYRIKNNILNEIIFLFGLIFIFSSSIILNNNSYFPGINALYPTIGAFLIIFSKDSKFIGIFLRNKLINFFGYISFSLYLYHWPVYVFLKYFKFTEISLIDKFFCILISVFFGFLSYKFIEKAYLAKKIFKLDKKILTCTVLTILMSLNVVYSKGWDFRLSKLEKGIYFDNDNNFGGNCEVDLKAVKNEDCSLGNRNELDILLIGDSHGKALYNGIKEFSKKNDLNLTTFEDMCKTYPNLSSNIVNCKINFPPPKTIIIGMKFYDYQYKDKDLESIAIQYLDKIIEIKKNQEFDSVKRLIIFGQVPEFYSSYGDLKSCYTRPLYIKKEACDEYYNLRVFEESSDLFKINQALEEKRLLNNFLKKHIELRSKNDLQLIFLDPFDKMCDSTKCLQVNNGKMVYFDSTHLSIFGSKYLVKGFDKELKKILGNNLK